MLLSWMCTLSSWLSAWSLRTSTSRKSLWVWAVWSLSCLSLWLWCLSLWLWCLSLWLWSDWHSRRSMWVWAVWSLSCLSLWLWCLSLWLWSMLPGAPRHSFLLISTAWLWLSHWTWVKFPRLSPCRHSVCQTPTLGALEVQYTNHPKFASYSWCYQASSNHHRTAWHPRLRELTIVSTWIRLV